MTTTPTSHARARCTYRAVRAATIALTFPAVLLIGCAAPKAPPETTQAPYSGPKARLGERVGKHVAVIECPTPGWGAVLDQVRDAPNEWTNAFVTLRRPSPIFVYPQVITRQEVSTDVPTSRPVRLFVRIHDNDDSGPGAYAPAAETAGTPSTPPATNPTKSEPSK